MKTRTLILKTNAYKSIYNVSKYGKESAYLGSLDNILHKPLLEWAGTFFDRATAEMNGEFNLTIIGNEFEVALLGALSRNCDKCKSINCFDNDNDVSAKKRLDQLCEIAGKYNIEYEATASTPQISITENDNSIKVIFETLKASLTLIRSEKEIIEYKDSNYIWECPLKCFDQYKEKLINYFVLIPKIQTIANKLNEIEALLTYEDKKKIGTALETDGVVTVTVKDCIKVGENTELNYSIFPKSFDMPNITAKTSDEKIVSVNGTTLLGQRPGIATIKFFKANETLAFACKDIEVVSDNSIKKISLNASKNVMSIGEELQLEINTLPIDADDLDAVLWATDSPKVATISSAGLVTAKGEGTCTVSCRTKSVKDELIITVLPIVERIEIIPPEINCFVADKVNVDCSVYPHNAVNANCVWSSTDDSIFEIAIENGCTEIKAKKIGRATLICSTSDGKYIVKCPVTVNSIMDKSTNKHIWLTGAAVSFTLTVLLLFFDVPAIVPGVLAACTVIGGIIAIVKNTKDLGWAVALMILAIFTTWMFG